MTHDKPKINSKIRNQCIAILTISAMDSDPGNIFSIRCDTKGKTEEKLQHIRNMSQYVIFSGSSSRIV